MPQKQALRRVRLRRTHHDVGEEGAEAGTGLVPGVNADTMTCYGPLSICIRADEHFESDHPARSVVCFQPRVLSVDQLGPVILVSWAAYSPPID